ncbi:MULTISPECIES: HAD family hydrolase [unclassified Leptolyngbya]|uniref:HAD family hydrolase n=1 Tax=unclassified Leptolyngbya TaxID=2650499 RepID=UPI0016823943|nr:MULTISPECIES: HAD family hydrolase [unclassified Leptolyngbya]MBD1909568.1 HAD family hydrolase [Leptolyngbya sp. FACHB-8]MBD2154106.1 HAD family hydrolase [Leptolyngbya sp. FACHB-16]
MIRLITDFDGPIMDVSERYYRVYQYCLAATRQPDQAVQTLSKKDFWRLKRSQVPEVEIGVFSGLEREQAKAFAKLRKETVHTIPYLRYDMPVPGAVETLERAQRLGFELTVMTMRRVRELDEAFERCNLGRFFKPERRFCLSDTYVKTVDVKDKPLLMQKAQAELPPAPTWMVGDTEADIAAAKSAGIPVIGVLSGIRDRQKLLDYEPDWIASNLVEALDIILENMGLGQVSA